MKRKLIDALPLLAGIALVLLIFCAALSVEAAGQKSEAETAEPAAPSYVDVVLKTEPTAAVEPAPTPEPDKPAYDPDIPLSEELQDVLRRVCEENGVELFLALGVIEVESGFDPGADNGLCYGLMQLNRRYFPDNLSPAENIRCGVEYLGRLLARYGDISAALTAYNAGYDTGSRVYANTVLAAAEKWERNKKRPPTARVHRQGPCGLHHEDFLSITHPPWYLQGGEGK